LEILKTSIGEVNETVKFDTWVPTFFLYVKYCPRLQMTCKNEGNVLPTSLELSTIPFNVKIQITLLGKLQASSLKISAVEVWRF
jgi:hypothetical protein